MYSVVVGAFARKAAKEGLTIKDVAHKLSRKPATIAKLLSSPEGWTLEDVSDLLLAMGYEIDSIIVRPI